MKTVFDKSTRAELITRINSLNDKSINGWGRMNVFQMIKHCILEEEMFLGKKKYKQAFIGRIFGKIAMKKVLKDENPLKRSSPTVPEFVIKETSGDINAEKSKWVSLVGQYVDFTTDNFIHPFFGRMTKEQIGYMAYKHIDHHLRQFGA